ncbi:unnamed protein product, partial [Prorocentrum cordatum]
MDGLRAHVDNTRADVMRTLAAVQQNLVAVGNSFQSHCERIDQQMEQRFGQIRNEIHEQNNNITSMQSEINELRQLLGAVRAETPSATQAVPAGGNGFDRKVDTSIIVLRSRDPVPRQNALTGFMPVLDAANIDATDVEIEGDPIAKRFQVRFKGAHGYATRRASQTLSAMRTLGPNPDWMQLTAKTATNANTPLYVSSDKNPFQIQREIGLKLLRAAIEQEYTGRRFYSDKVKGELSLNWKVFVRITPVPGVGEPPNIEWARNHIDALGLDRAKLSEIAARVFAREEAQNPGLGYADWRGSQDRVWTSLFSSLTEIELSDPTRASIATSSTSVIDRLFVSLPGWVATHMHATGYTKGQVEILNHRGLSDHVGIAVDLRPAPPKDPKQQPIPNAIFQSPVFRQYVQSHLDVVDLSLYDPPYRLQIYKNLLRDAARFTRQAPGAIETLYACLWWVLEGGTLGYDFNFLLGAFLPKGSKATKCQIVPLSGPFTPALAALYQQKLRSLVVDWSEFAVVPNLLYLGTWMGPNAEEKTRAPTAGRAAAPGVPAMADLEGQPAAAAAPAEAPAAEPAGAPAAAPAGPPVPEEPPAAGRAAPSWAEKAAAARRAVPAERAAPARSADAPARQPRAEEARSARTAAAGPRRRFGVRLRTRLATG